MPATSKRKPSILDRLIGKRTKSELASPSAISAKLALRRSKMQNTARFRLWELAVSIAMAPNDSTVSVKNSAAILAEAGIDQAEFDHLVKMVRNRAKRDTYSSLANESFEAFRESRRTKHEHEVAKKRAIAHYDEAIKKAEQEASRCHAESRRYRALAEEASLPIPVIEQILNGVRDENRRLRGTVASIEDQLAAAEKRAEGAKAPVSDLIAEYIRYIGRSVHGAKLEARNETLCMVFEDLDLQTLSTSTRQQIEEWSNDELSESRIEKAKREAKIFLNWCRKQGYTGDEGPSGVDQAERIQSLRAALEDAQAELAASDDLLAEVESEAEKPVPFHSRS